MTKPDQVVARTPMADFEAKIGIQPLEELHAERDMLVKQVAPLRAKWGQNGLGPHLRKAQLSKVQELLRAQAAADGEKVTESRIDQMGHADQRYLDWLAQGLLEYEQMIIVEEEIDQINERIIRGGQVAKYETAAMHLA